MELKVNEYQLPAEITFNFEELKQELAEKVSKYETLVYTDDEIKLAKSDKANLNKLKKALNDERIRREKDYMQPFNVFKTQINEIIGIIDKPIAVIDKQVKEFEEKRRADKQEEIELAWDSLDKPEWLTLSRIFDEKWLNVSVSLKSILEAIDKELDRIKSDLKTLEALSEFSFEATEEYKRTLDINRAIAEGQRLVDIQKRKEEQERLKAEAEEKAKAEKEAAEIAKAQEEKQVDISEHMTPPEEPKEEGQWINFSAYLTVAQAVQLKEFFNRNNIEFKAI